MLQDIRHAARSLLRSPGFTAVVVATLALGIGMNTAVFSVANNILFSLVPYPDAGRLVWMTEYSLRESRDIFTANAEYVRWKNQARSFEQVAGYGDDDVALVANERATQERIAFVADDFWPITGAQPAIGRLFGQQEPDQLVLSWALYQRRFQGDARVIGSAVSLNGHPFRILGVLPENFRFRFPQQYIPGDEVRDIDGYIAIPTDILALPSPLPATTWEQAQQRFGPAPHAVFVIGKLKRGLGFEQARAEIQTIYDRLNAERPAFERDLSLDFAPLSEKLGRGERRSLVVLLAAVGFVLLIACANIANLLIARSVSRMREAAIRAAMGAGKFDIMRQSLSEMMLLAMFGGASGLFIAWSCTRFSTGIVLSGGRQLDAVQLDTRVLCFTLAITLFTGLLAGLGPALSLMRANVHVLLKVGGGTTAGNPHRLWGRGGLVALEFALAILLLTGAGLMLKSLWRMNQRPEGFAPEKILTMRITFSGPRYETWPPKQAYAEQLLSRLRALPGVPAAAVDAGGLNTSLHVGRDEVGAVVRGVSSEYLRAIGVPLLKGEWPKEGSLFGVVVNEAFARKTSANVVGRTITGSILRDRVLGIVADFKARRLDADPMPEVYMPYERFPSVRSMRVLVRAAGDVTAIEAPVRSAIAGVDAAQPAYEFGTLEKELEGSIASRRMQLWLLGTFAGMAMLLATIGIHGVMAWSVGQRTREIGVRMAVGASQIAVVGLILRQGMGLALAGICAGLVAAATLTRAMSSLLYGVKPDDPLTFAAVAFGMTTVAMIACCVPSFRAARVDPVVALRGE